MQFSGNQALCVASVGRRENRHRRITQPKPSAQSANELGSGTAAPAMTRDSTWNTGFVRAANDPGAPTHDWAHEPVVAAAEGTQPTVAEAFVIDAVKVNVSGTTTLGTAMASVRLLLSQRAFSRTQRRAHLLRPPLPA
jgi:hypothetical protein